MPNGIVYLGLGAALMYLMDPQAGRKRRAELRDRYDATARKLQHGRDVVVRDARNRAQGLAAQARSALEARREGGVVATGSSLATIAQDTAASWRRPHWSPAQRAFAGGCGTALAAYGYLRGGLKGFALCALGGGLIARATANERLAEAAQGHADEAPSGYLPRESAEPQPSIGSNGSGAAHA
jgi:hypothetical protein